MLNIIIPVKTRTAPLHCLALRVLPKNITENSTVKNFLVVVTMEQDSGPKPETYNIFFYI